jgi:ABC-type sugar transport system permease subunit
MTTLTRRRGWCATPYLFLAPALAVIFIFIIYPGVNMMYLSLCRADLIGKTTFTGVDNYIALFTSGDFHSSLKASVIFMIVVVIVQTAIALAVALLVQSEKKGMGALRTLFFIPVVLSFVVVAFLWKFLYNPDFGLINALLGALGIARQGFLSVPSQALGSMIVSCIWKSFAFFMMIFIAGLKEIPNELYEAAYMDGVKPAQKIRFITLPLLRRTILFVVVVTTMDSFIKVFTPVYVMTDGGPRGRTDLLVYYIWRTAFRLGDIGYASAIAMVMFLFVLVVNLIQLKLGEARDAL